MKRLFVLVLAVAIVLSGSVFAFAAEPDPNINIVNPAAETSVTSTSLLISVKITKQETIKVNVLKENVVISSVTATSGAVTETRTVTWDSIFASDPFTSQSNLSFYTKKLEDISPGNYIVRVDTLDSEGKVVYETTRDVTVAEKEVTNDGALFSNNNSGTLNNFLQSLLKSIFGD